MMEFKGFPTRMQFTPIPNVVFSSLLPQIADNTELKALLNIFAILYPKKGNLRFVSFQELLGRASFISNPGEESVSTLKRALESLVRRGVLIHQAMQNGEQTEDLYFLNNEANRLITARIQNGEIVLPGLKTETPVAVSLEETPDIFTLYEQNIGMLTPLIADELRDAQKQYPENWITDAIKEAVKLNKHNWRYIARILENWSTEGKGDGTYRGNLKKNTDPDKYIRGKYGHMVQR
jgi:DNA replication protein